MFDDDWFDSFYYYDGRPSYRSYPIATSEDFRRAFSPTPEERAKDIEALAKAVRPMTKEEIAKMNMGYYTQGTDGIIHCPKTGHYERKDNKIKALSEEEAKKRQDEVIKVSKWQRWAKRLMRAWRKKS